MKKIIKIVTMLSLVGAGSVSLHASDKSGEALFQAHCAVCHVATHPNDPSKLTAPPVMGVVRHVKMNHATKESAVAFIVDYVQTPDKAKAVYPANAIEKFGLMPSLKGAISPDDLQKIAEYMYDTYGNRQGRGGGKGQHREGCNSDQGAGQGYGRGGSGRGQGLGRGHGHGRNMQ